MDQEEIGLLRRVLGSMVFQPLDGLVGRRLHADRFEDITNTADLLPLYELEGELMTEPSNVRGVLLKYGFVELSFRLTRWPDVSPARAKRLLSVLRDEELDRTNDDPEMQRLRMDWLRDLCDEISANELWMTVFADTTTRPTGSLMHRARATKMFKTVPDGFFPCTFVVTDAYITNAPSVSWMRRFYW